MKNSITLFHEISKLFLAVSCLLFLSISGTAQTFQKASSQDHSGTGGIGTLTVENPGNAVDGSGKGDLTTFAKLKASSGAALGIGAFNSYITLKFNNTIPAGTRTYVKIEASQDGLLSSLVGGAIGDLLFGGVLGGKQRIKVQVYNNSTLLYTRNSQNKFDDIKVRLVSDANGEYYLALTPDVDYNKIKISNSLNAALGLGKSENLKVYGAFYTTSSANCDAEKYTAFSASGGILDLNALGNNGVSNPERVIDNDKTNYSQLNISGTISAASAVRQSVFFGIANDDAYRIRFQSTADILNLDLADNVNIIGYDGDNVVDDIQLSQLLDVDLLGLFQNNQIVSAIYEPSAPVDRVQVRLNSLVNVGLTSTFRLYAIDRNPLQVILNDATDITANSATLQATLKNPACYSGNGYGFEYSNDPNFPNGNTNSVSSNNLMDGDYSSSISNLEPETTYYYRAYQKVRDYNDPQLDLKKQYTEIKSFITKIITWDGTKWNNNNQGPQGKDAMITGDYDSSTDGPFTANTLMITSGNTVTTDDMNGITLLSDVTTADNTAKIDATNGKVIYGNSNGGSLIIDGDDYTKNTLKHVVIKIPQGSVATTKNDINITASFNIDRGDLTLDDGCHITFVSNANGTATFGEVKDCANTAIVYKGSGIVTVERYITAGDDNTRGMRALASPVDSDLTIRENWQEGVNNTSLDYSNNKDPKPGYGMHITGSHTGQNGFDATQTGNLSIFHYDNSAQSYTDVQNTDQNTLYAGEAFYATVRGDRSINLNYNAPPPTNLTLETTGKLRFCDVDVSSDLKQNPAVSGNTFNLVGNPYAAPVNMKELLNNSSANLNVNSVYVLNPSLGDFGGYTVVNPQDGTTTPPTDNSIFMQSGQAVFFLNSQGGGAPTLIFKESQKGDPTKVRNPFEDEGSSIGTISINLYKNQNELVDGTLVKLGHQFSNTRDAFDAPKISNKGETFGLMDQDHNEFAILARQGARDVDEVHIPFKIERYSAQGYQFKIELNNVDNQNFVLRDHYLNEDTALGAAENTVSFQVNGNNASAAVDRFELVIKPATLSTELPEDEDFAVYPNPVKQHTVAIAAPSLKGQKVQIEMYTLDGRRIVSKSHEFTANKTALQLNNLSSGLYILIISTQNQSFAKKLIIE